MAKRRKSSKNSKAMVPYKRSRKADLSVSSRSINKGGMKPIIRGKASTFTSIANKTNGYKFPVIDGLSNNAYYSGKKATAITSLKGPMTYQGLRL